MKKEELQARAEQLRAELKERDEKVENELKTMFETIIPFKVKCYISISSFRDLKAKVQLLDENDVDIFGADFTISFNVYRFDNPTKMKINHGSIGEYSAVSGNGAYKYRDILLGKVWENEEQITQIYNDIDYTKDKELNEVYREFEQIERDERNAIYLEQKRKEEAEKQEILNHVKETMLVYTKSWINGYVKAKIAKITNKLIYFESKYPTGRVYMNKNDFVKKIKSGKLFVEIPEGAVTD